MTIKRALCVGINAYPNAPLQGCVNDARSWSDLLTRKGYWVTQLLDDMATKEEIHDQIQRLLAVSHWGDRFVFTYSGHGSWVPDDNGDESDGRDEVLCAFDYEDGGLIKDDELAQWISKRGVRRTILSDSCHSGSVSRLMLAADRLFIEGKTPRYLSPFNFLDPGSTAWARAERVARVEADTTPRTSTGSVLISGCGDDELSWDAYIGGRFQGAFTEAAIRAHLILEARGVTPRMSAWHKEIRTILPSEAYPQAPQLYASLWQRGWAL